MWMTVALHNVLKLRKVRLLTFICFFFLIFPDMFGCFVSTVFQNVC